jgi:hypothetical protein
MTRGDPAISCKPMQAEFYRRFAPVALANGFAAAHAQPGGEARAIQYGYC